MHDPKSTGNDGRVTSRTRVNFLLTEDGYSKLARPGEDNPWACTRRQPSVISRWDAFEKWQRETRLSQAKTVGGVPRLPRKLSLKQITKTG